MRILGKAQGEDDVVVHSEVKIGGKGKLDIRGSATGFYGTMCLPAAMLSAGGSVVICASEREGSCLRESLGDEKGEGIGEMHPDSGREGSAWASRSRVAPTGNDSARHRRTARGPAALRSSRRPGAAYALSVAARPPSTVASPARPSRGAWCTYKEQERWKVLVAKKRHLAVIDDFIRRRSFSVVG